VSDPEQEIASMTIIGMARITKVTAATALGAMNATVVGQRQPGAQSPATEHQFDCAAWHEDVDLVVQNKALVELPAVVFHKGLQGGNMLQVCQRLLTASIATNAPATCTKKAGLGSRAPAAYTTLGYARVARTQVRAFADAVEESSILPLNGNNTEEDKECPHLSLPLGAEGMRVIENEFLSHDALPYSRYNAQLLCS